MQHVLQTWRKITFRLGLAGFVVFALVAQAQDHLLGREVAIPRHLQDGQEFEIPISRLIQFGEQLFTAKFTIQEGAGRPLTKGTGAPISDPNSPLVFPRNFDRVSSPDSNSCAGCHNAPAPGGGGDAIIEFLKSLQVLPAGSRSLVVDERGDPRPSLSRER